MIEKILTLIATFIFSIFGWIIVLYFLGADETHDKGVLWTILILLSTATTCAVGGVIL